MCTRGVQALVDTGDGLGLLEVFDGFMKTFRVLECLVSEVLVRILDMTFDREAVVFELGHRKNTSDRMPFPESDWASGSVPSQRIPDDHLACSFDDLFGWM